jgi:hypothetical protein
MPGETIMAAHKAGSSKSGKAVSWFILRILLFTLPLRLISQYGSLVVGQHASHFSPTQVWAAKIFFTVVAICSLVSIFRPKILVKPIVGIIIFLGSLYALERWSTQLPFRSILNPIFFYTAAFACAYCVLYDTAMGVHWLYEKLHRRFSPITEPVWGRVEGESTTQQGALLENYVCDLYKRIYGNAMTTTEMKARGLIPNGPGDQGADVVVQLPGGRRLIIQCKNYSGMIGNGAVQEIISAKAHYRADELAIISPNGFTSKCIELAESNSSYYNTKIELIDQSKLAKIADIANRVTKKVA